MLPHDQQWRLLRGPARFSSENRRSGPNLGTRSVKELMEAFSRHCERLLYAMFQSPSHLWHWSSDTLSRQGSGL